MKHVNEICVKSNCEIHKCTQRHPIRCKYYQDYQRCKFGSYCYYRHEETENNKENLKDFIEKTNVLENKVFLLSEQLNEKSTEMKDLELKLIALEKVLKQSEDKIELLNSLKDSIEQINGRVQEVEQNNYILMHAVDDVEKDTKVIQIKLDALSEHNFACNFCDQTFRNEDTPQNHTRIDHGRVLCKR